MRILLSLLAIALMLLGSVGFAQDNNPLIGSWELVSHKSIGADTTIMADMSTLKSIKILSATHFAYVTTKKTSDTTMVGAGAGPYTLTDNVYTEILDQASFARVRGKVYDFTYRVEGDLWTMTGDLEDFNVRIEEVWRRAK